MKIAFSPPDIREEDIEAVVEVLRSGWITSGPVGAEFERAIIESTGCEGAVLLNSCTAGLELALRFLEVGPGDEVIVPAYTYTASASVVDHVGATIVLVDCEPNQYVPSVQSILDAITPKTKAVICVDIGGVPFDTESLIESMGGIGINSENETLLGLGRPAVIADAAHSFGARRNVKNTGQIADFSAFSFHAVKNLTTAEGGALVWRSNLPVDSVRIAEKIRRLSLHGQSKDALSKMKAGAWEYDILELGYKYNMPDTLAALGLSQLKRYQKTMNRRHEIVKSYDSSIRSSFSSLSHEGLQFRSSAHLYLLDLGDHAFQREEIISRMALDGVAVNVHYKPLPMLTAYRSLGFRIEDFPEAKAMYERELTLPLHTQLSDQHVDYVLDVFQRAIH